jgi:hypothetical protein
VEEKDHEKLLLNIPKKMKNVEMGESGMDMIREMF